MILPHYKYDALPLDPTATAIRVFELCPGVLDDPISILLSSAQLMEHPTYEALSYCWGDAAKTTVIECNRRVLSVTDSLYGALVRLRQPDKSRVLWADAICINQLNIEEKNHQVRLMQDIYKKATHVLIWLGQEEGHSWALKAAIPELLESQKLQKAAGDIRSLMEMSAADREAYCLCPLWYERYDGMLEITFRPWFHRVWIVQEFAMAQDATFFCGNWQFPWETFIEAWKYVVFDLDIASSLALSVKTDLSVRSLSVPSLPRTRHLVKSDNVSFSSLLFSHRFAKASDPRDKVFALYGLVSTKEKEQLGISIDYTRDVEDIYIRVAIRILLTEKHLDLLSGAGLRNNGLPSWVPDWRSEVTHDIPITRIIENFGYPDQFTFQASQNMPSSLEIRGKTLALQGHFFAKVNAIGPELPQPPAVSTQTTMHRHILESFGTSINNRVVIMDWEEFSQAQSKEKYLSGEDMVDVFWQTLILGLNLRRQNSSAEQDLEVAFRLWYPETFFILTSWVPKWLKYHWIKVVLVILHIITALIYMLLSKQNRRVKKLEDVMELRGRTMFTTQSGYLGLAGGSVKAGDEVYILAGSKVPLILRPSGTDFQLIGECYVHGIMYGGAYEPEKCCEIKLI